MIALLERLLPLWTQPAGSRDDAEAAFREVYADPVVVNGLEMPIVELVGRARALQQAFDGLSMHILDTVETPDRVVIAFLMRGRHVDHYRPARRLHVMTFPARRRIRRRTHAGRRCADAARRCTNAGAVRDE